MGLKTKFLLHLHFNSFDFITLNSTLISFTQCNKIVLSEFRYFKFLLAFTKFCINLLLKTNNLIGNSK